MNTEICSLADWITAAASVVSALAVVVGLVAAFSQLETWRKQAVSNRKADVAVAIVSAAKSIQDVMDVVRRNIQSVPADKINDPYYLVNERANFLRENRHLFDDLRTNQVRAGLLALGTEIDELITRIFALRNKFYGSLEIVADYAREKPQTPSEQELYQEARYSVFSRPGSKDEFRQELVNAVDRLEILLGPVARHSYR